MKYAVLILDGVTDGPCEELGGKTPLAAATLPHLSRLAATGRVGLAATVPESGPRSAGAALASLLGCPPQTIGDSDAALALLGSGTTLAPTDTAMILDLVAARKPSGEWSTAPDAVLDEEPPPLTAEERDLLLRALLSAWRERTPELARHLELANVEGRTLLIDRSGRPSRGVEALPPAAAAGRGWRISWPGGGEAGSAEALRALIEISAAVLPAHEVNTGRIAHDLPPANLAWIHGLSRAPALTPIGERFGLSGVLFTRNAAGRGLARCAGWEIGEEADSIARTGAAAAQALGRRDIVAVHVTVAPEDAPGKVAALERLDAQLIGPVAERLEQFGDPEADASARGWRLLLAPSHVIDEDTGEIAGPAPFLIAGAWIRSVVRRPFDEESALGSDLVVDPGHELMEYFLFGGQARVKAPTRRGRGLAGLAARRGPNGRFSR